MAETLWIKNKSKEENSLIFENEKEVGVLKIIRKNIY